ncbi:MAG: pyridoxine 5'-phosphate synthase [Pseudomonadota bacterium]|nr:pyridoxine 5'-phosphate synthase [Pseudomonadota bacterium]
MTNFLRLGVNIDHVATIRNARGGIHPDPVQAAIIAEKAGADGITAHLREDRRHISDKDIKNLMEQLKVPLNLEIAATIEMLNIALSHKPHAACIVPEKREEKTTEGGLDAVGGKELLKPYIQKLVGAGIRVSLFIEPDDSQLEAAISLGAPVVELHTGAYCNAEGKDREFQLQRITNASIKAKKLGLECHAGHGLTFETVKPIAALKNIKELNIGHFLIGESIFNGLENSIKRMRSIIVESRKEISI